MRQKLGFVAVWVGATVMATSVAWFGVRDVLHRGAFDDVKIEPLSAADGRTGETPPPIEPAEFLGTPAVSPSPGESGTPTPAARPRPARSEQAGGTSARPRTSPSPKRSSSSPGIKPVPARTTPTTARTTAAPRPARTTSAPRAAQTTSAPQPATQAAANQNVRVVQVKGGTVSFTIENGACRLVSAVPVSGYQTRISQADGWIRVDLFQGDHGSSAFCIGHENRTDTWEY
ncbi:hypothetical protein ACFFMN_07500 [Planobispora siamensis]|uniref:hypothetical protein n=1 Tax=Planobispora siamensis TaxID=936338 RepID=UPI00195192A6|nr:hypothetical protein [Planobispora siamensis]